MSLPPRRTRARRLLVVEDDPDLARLAKLHLEDEGYRVRVEQDGRRALELARAGEFDLLVLDLMLPGLDGLEICRALRGDSNYVPIIVVTAKGSEVDRVVGLEIGADDYLTKPVGYRELVARVRSIFRRIDALDRGELEPQGPLLCGALEIEPVRRVYVSNGIQGLGSLASETYDWRNPVARIEIVRIP